MINIVPPRPKVQFSIGWLTALAQPRRRDRPPVMLVLEVKIRDSTVRGDSTVRVDIPCYHVLLVPEGILKCYLHERGLNAR